MRKMMFLIVATALFISCNNDKTAGSKDSKSETDMKDDNSRNDRDDDKNESKSDGTGSWSAIDVKLFTTTCVNAAVNGGMDRDLAESYCSCMQKKIEAKYPNSDDAGQFDKNSSWAKEMAVECLGDEASTKPTGNSNSKGWTRKEELQFVDECVNAAMKNGLDELDAQSYCDCMQHKIEEIYPDYAEANRSVNLESPSMKKMVKECLLVD